MNNLEALKRVFTCIDNTTLEGCDTYKKVETLCRRSVEMKDARRGIGHVAAVCVYPVFVKQARGLLHGSGIKVASVAGAFPHGQSPIKVKLEEVRYALDEGAEEIDMVLSRGLLLEGEYTRVREEVAMVKGLCDDRRLKVILETGELPSERYIKKAAELAIEGGADFIKTSTGKIAVNATLEAAEVMLGVIKNHYERTGKWVGFKAAGGISSPDEVLKYERLAERIIGEKQITNQFFRIGASRLTERLFEFLTQ